MRRIKSVLAVVAAMVTMMALAGPAFASTDGGCIAAVPTSPLSAVTVAVTSLPLLHLLQIAAAVVVALAVVGLAWLSKVRPSMPASTAQATS